MTKNKKSKPTTHYFFRFNPDGWNSIWANSMAEARTAIRKQWSYLNPDMDSIREIDSKEYNTIIRLSNQD